MSSTILFVKSQSLIGNVIPLWVAQDYLLKMSQSLIGNVIPDSLIQHIDKDTAYTVSIPHSNVIHLGPDCSYIETNVSIPHR